MNSKYKRMLEGMQAKEKRKRRPPALRAERPGGKKTEPWFLYILECADQSLYTGITNNLERRFKAHTDGRASRFTRTRRPVTMRYQESCKSRTQALIREYVVKSLPRKKKLLLINRHCGEAVRPTPIDRAADGRLVFRCRTIGPAKQSDTKCHPRML